MARVAVGNMSSPQSLGGASGGFGSSPEAMGALQQYLMQQALGKAGSVQGSRLLDFYKAIRAETEEEKPTAEMKNRAVAIRPAVEIVNRLEKRKSFPDIGITGALTAPTLLKTFGGRGVSGEVQDLDSLYGNLRQVVLKAYQGGRMSDRDFAQAEAYIPTIKDEPGRVRIKLKNLKWLLNRISSPQYDISEMDITPENRPSLDSFLY